MRKIKNISFVIIVFSVILILGGCGNDKTQEESGSNFVLKYEADKGVDRVRCLIGDFEIGMEPMFEATKVEKGATSQVVLTEEEVEFLIQIYNGEKVVYEKDDFKVDLSEGKKANISIIDKEDGTFDIEIENK